MKKILVRTSGDKFECELDITITQQDLYSHDSEVWSALFYSFMCLFVCLITFSQKLCCDDN